MKKSLTKKIAIAILIILLFSFVAPLNSSQAISLAGVINKPLTSFFMLIFDGINSLLTLLLQGQSAFTEVKNGLEGDATYADKLNALIDPSKIFANDVAMLNANIFEAPGTTSWNVSGDSLAVVLKKVVAGTYEIIRNLSAVVLLVLLIYTGIRIVLASNSAQEKAKWNMILLDWVKALALVIFIHVIMIGIFWISDRLTEAIMDITSNGDSFIVQIRKSFNDMEWDGAALSYWLLVIMYGYITYMTVVFAIAYLKRLMYIIILIVIAPIIAVTYALGGQTKQIFSTWLREYIMAVLLQPYHVIIYYILITLPLSMLNTSSGSGAVQDFFLGDNAFQCIYALIAMSFIRPAEKMLRDLFGFEAAKVANMGSFDSGKATLDKGKQVVQDTAMVVGGAMTGNVQMAANGAVNLMDDTSGEPAVPAENVATNAESDITNAMTRDANGNNSTNSGLHLDGNELETGAGTGAGAGAGAGNLNISNLTVGTLTAANMQGNNTGAQNGNSQSGNAENGNSQSGNEESGNTQNGDPITAKDIPELPEGKKPLSERLADKIRYGDYHNIPGSIEGKIKGSGLYKGAQGLKNGAKNKIKELGSNAGKKIEATDSKVLKKGLQATRATGRIGSAVADRTKSGIRYLRSDKGKEDLLKLGSSLGAMRDTMYLQGQSPGDSGKFFQDRLKSMQEKGKKTADAFVEDRRHIEFVKKYYGEKGQNIDDKGAKAILKDASGFLKYGVNDVGLAVTLLDYKNEHKLSHEQSVQQYARSEENKGAIKVNNFINNPVQVNELIERRVSETAGATGATPETIRADTKLMEGIKAQVREEIKNAAPYIASGTAKNASDVVRLNNLEKAIKEKANVSKDADVKKITESTEKIIAKALKEGVADIKIPNSDKNSSIKAVEKIANEQLQEMRRNNGNA